MTAAFVALLAVQLAAPQVDGLLEGRIVDARTGGPLADAVVSLQPSSDGSVLTARRPLSQAALIRTASDRDGRYRFHDLVGGDYVLRVERLGYRPARVEVTLGRGLPPQLTLGLEVEPIALEPLVVEASAGAPQYRDPRTASEAADRLTVDEVRRRRFLETDAYVVGQEEIVAAGNFPEPDIMRAIQRLPGMSSRDAYAGELWTRGSGWELTRVSLDDLPLFEPLIAGGALGGVGPSAIGTVFVHAGPRPVTVGEGGAGVVRLGTRAAADVDGLPIHAELGLGTAQGTTERRFAGGRAGLLLSARRTWYDRIWNGPASDEFDPEGPFDYHAGSSLVRLDFEVGDRSNVEYSRFRSSDRLDGNAAMLITGSTGAWGNATDQVTFSTPLLGRFARIVLGASRYDATVERSEASFVPPVDPSVVVLEPGSTRIRFRKAAVEIPYVASTGFAAGVEVTTQSLESTGVATGAYLGHSDAPSPASATVLSAWSSTRATPSERLDVEVGLRLDSGTRPAGSTSLRLSPHIAVRHATTQRLFLSLSGRRSYQYLRRVGPAGTPFGSGHTFGHAWALSGRAAPALRTDLLSAGVERNLAYGWWLSGTGWLRRATGVPSLDPTPGTRPATRVEWMAGVNRAQGVEVQLRRIAGPVTGHVSYGWLASTTRVTGIEVAASAERPHMLDALVSWQARPTLRMGLSLFARSGTPYTRRLLDPCVDDLGRADACGGAPRTTFGVANTFRTPGSTSVDFSLDWVRRHRTWGWGLTVQLFNVLGVDQTGAYRETECPPTLTRDECVRSPFAIDRFYSGLGFPLPMLTVRAWF